MCDLCSVETVSSEQVRLLECAARLETIAEFYRRMASGDAKPHGEQAKLVGYLIREQIAEFQEEW